jgi:hypothetical protein
MVYVFTYLHSFVSIPVHILSILTPLFLQYIFHTLHSVPPSVASIISTEGEFRLYLFVPNRLLIYYHSYITYNRLVLLYLNTVASIISTEVILLTIKHPLRLVFRAREGAVVGVKTPPTCFSSEGGEGCVVVVSEWYHLRTKKTS